MFLRRSLELLLEQYSSFQKSCELNATNLPCSTGVTLLLVYLFYPPPFCLLLSTGPAHFMIFIGLCRELSFQPPTRRPPANVTLHMHAQSASPLFFSLALKRTHEPRTSSCHTHVLTHTHLLRQAFKPFPRALRGRARHRHAGHRQRCGTGLLRLSLPDGPEVLGVRDPQVGGE